MSLPGSILVQYMIRDLHNYQSFSKDYQNDLFIWNLEDISWQQLINKVLQAQINTVKNYLSIKWNFT